MVVGYHHFWKHPQISFGPWQKMNPSRESSVTEKWITIWNYIFRPKFKIRENSSRWWQLKYFFFSPRSLGEDEPIKIEHMFSSVLVQPPISPEESSWKSMKWPCVFENGTLSWLFTDDPVNGSEIRLTSTWDVHRTRRKLMGIFWQCQLVSRIFCPSTGWSTNQQPTSHLNADRLGAGRCLGVRVTHIIHVWYFYLDLFGSFGYVYVVVEIDAIDENTYRMHSFGVYSM